MNKEFAIQLCNAVNAEMAKGKSYDEAWQLANSGTSEGAKLGWEHRPHHAEFGSPEKATELHQLLSDFKKNGLAKQLHLDKLDRAEQYLGIGAHAAKNQVSSEDEEAFARTQGALDSFHRTIIVPHMAIKPKKSQETLHASKLRGMKAYHATASEISQDKTIPFKEREERVKGLLMQGRSVFR